MFYQLSTGKCIRTLGPQHTLAVSSPFEYMPLDRHVTDR